jgi:hypothetical protein
MSWHPNDLVTDADLSAYEREILTTFAVQDWRERRQKAIEDWLWPLLESKGFDPMRFRTRFDADQVWGQTSSIFTDLTSGAQTASGLALATILAAASDYLYIGSTAPFRGLSVRMADAVNSTTSLLTLQVWADTWLNPADLLDGTKRGTAVFAAGGAITWGVPDGLVRRSVNSSDDLFWARLAVSSAPTGAVAGPLAVIRRSRLCAAVTLRTLALIFREAPTQQAGPWMEKAEWYEAEAERAWTRVSGAIGGEFDTNDDDMIDPTEAAQTAAEVSGGGLTLERS